MSRIPLYTDTPAADLERAAELLREAELLTARAREVIRSQAQAGERTWAGTGDLDHLLYRLGVDGEDAEPNSVLATTVARMFED